MISNKKEMTHRKLDLVLALLISIQMFTIGVPVAMATDAPVSPPEEQENAANEKQPGFKPENWSIHFQATGVSQGHPGFTSPYSGLNSFTSTGDWANSFTSTLFLGRKAWKGGEVYVNPEVSAGSGLSATKGVAGFPNGEVYRVDTPSPKLNLSRLFIRQTFGFGGETENIEGDLNQLARTEDVRRITLIAGKFSLNDFFDDNAFSHDPRTQFLNWGFMDNLAWDYAADTRGYTWGFVLEYNQAQFAFRWAEVLEPKEANQLEFDTNIAHAHGDNWEFEYRYLLSKHPGKARLLAYLNHAHMGSYEQTLSDPAYQMDVTQTRAYRAKYGFGLNLEQEILADLGLFSRLGWNNGQTETWAFTEVDRTASIGANLKGTRWSRPQDVAGLAVLVNWLSKPHADYISAGGYGFIIGDGKLNYAPEEIIEAFYLWKPWKYVGMTGDFQFINHPAYNADRGPAAVGAARLHFEI